MVYKWYSIFLFYILHFYFITSFEVLFYLYYILPYERNLIYDLFDVDKATAEFDLGDTTTTYNVTNSTSWLYETNHCRNNARRMKEANDILYGYCNDYLVSINVIVLIILFGDVYIMYHQRPTDNNNHTTNKPNTFVSPPSPTKTPISALKSNSLSFMGYETVQEHEHQHTIIELTELTNRQKNQTEDDIICEPIDLEAPNQINNNASEETNKKIPPSMISIFAIISPFSTYYLKNSQFIQEFNSSMGFIVIIGLFEYIFFTQIVNQFKVFNLREFLCDLVSKQIITS